MTMAVKLYFYAVVQKIMKATSVKPVSITEIKRGYKGLPEMHCDKLHYLKDHSCFFVQKKKHHYYVMKRMLNMNVSENFRVKASQIGYVLMVSLWCASL